MYGNLPMHRTAIHPYTKKPVQVRLSINFTVKQLKYAEYVLVRDAQKMHPPNDVMIYNLDLVADEHGILRSRGRYKNSPVLHPDAQDPMYIPKESRLAAILISTIHRKLHHAGPMIVLAELRQRFWIPGIVRLIKSVTITNIITRCFVCFKKEARPYDPPETAQLPATRSGADRPFQYTGVDFAGPFPVRCKGKDPKGKDDYTGSAHIALFTCMTYRCVHLEVSAETSGQDFVHCFRRFESVRGTPEAMLSDNAPNFVLAHKLIQDRLGHEPILWKFTAPHAPWQGGVYERLMSPLKNAIKSAMGTTILNLKEFTTLVKEVEANINCRPITNYSEAEPIRPLRPMDLLLPLGFKSKEISFDEDKLNDPDFLPKITSRDKLEKTFDKLEKVLLRFKKYWKDYYFAALREKHRHVERGELTIKVGDIVIVFEEKTHPSGWKIAIVEELIPDHEGIIRSAWIKTSTRERIKRHIVHLFPLELQVSRPRKPSLDSSLFDNSAPNIASTSINTPNITAPSAPPSRQQPKRKAKHNVKYFSDGEIDEY
jgi:hypothetical protein